MSEQNITESFLGIPVNLLETIEKTACEKQCLPYLKLILVHGSIPSQVRRTSSKVLRGGWGHVLTENGFWKATPGLLAGEHISSDNGFGSHSILSRQGYAQLTHKYVVRQTIAVRPWIILLFSIFYQSTQSRWPSPVLPPGGFRRTMHNPPGFSTSSETPSMCMRLVKHPVKERKGPRDHPNAPHSIETCFPSLFQYSDSRH